MAYWFAKGFRCVRRGDVWTTSFQEVMGVTAVESLAKVGLKTILNLPQRGAAIVAGAPADKLVKAAAVS